MAIIIQSISVTCRARNRSRSAHYKDIQDGLYPHPVRVGLRAVGHPEYENDAMNAARIAGMSDEEIRALVVKLEAARKAAS